jgi:hypothetical protein
LSRFARAKSANVVVRSFVRSSSFNRHLIEQNPITVTALFCLCESIQKGRDEISCVAFWILAVPEPFEIGRVNRKKRVKLADGFRSLWVSAGDARRAMTTFVFLLVKSTV